MRTESVLVRFKIAGHGKGKLLDLKRTPKYLRFVFNGSDWGTLDALDQLDDTPRPGEHMIAAVIGESSNIHVDGMKNGRRCGWNVKIIDYDMIAVQPSQELMRDIAKWQAWCVEQEQQITPNGAQQ